MCATTVDKALTVCNSETPQLAGWCESCTQLPLPLVVHKATSALSLVGRAVAHLGRSIVQNAISTRPFSSAPSNPPPPAQRRRALKNQSASVGDGAIYTTGGATPALDLMLTLIRARNGYSAALDVASLYIYEEMRAQLASTCRHNTMSPWFYEYGVET